MSIRTTKTPFLLVLFYKSNGFHRPEDFEPHGRLPSDSVQIYTWKDATLTELANLLSSTINTANKRLSFRMLYNDNNRPRVIVKELGWTSTNERGDGDITLDEARFVIGDYLDVAIYDERRIKRW